MHDAVLGKLQCRDEDRGDGGTSLHRIDETRRQEGRERCPVDGDTQHALQPLQRLLDREELRGADVISVGVLGPLLIAIGLEQLIELHVPLRLAHDQRTLGLATAEGIDAQPGVRHQPRTGLLHRLQPSQLPLQRVGHLLAGRLLVLRRLRKHQARLQIGEPRGHHEIVGREFQPQPARLLHEHQILVDQRHHGDAPQIDLLIARKGQQDVERTLVSLQIEDQLALAGRQHIGGALVEIARGGDFGCHWLLPIVQQRPTPRVNFPGDLSPCRGNYHDNSKL